MQALSRFSEETYSSELNKTVTFDIQGLSADPVTITDETRFERTDYEVIQMIHCLINEYLKMCHMVKLHRLPVFQAT